MLRSLFGELSRFRTRRRIQGAERRRKAGDPRGALLHLPDVRDPEVLAVRGLALRDIGNLAGAIAALEAAIDLQGDQAPLLNELGLLVSEAGDAARARQCFERATALAPRLAAPIANLAVLHLRAMRPKDAIPLLERAVELAPKEHSHRLNLVAALRDADDLGRAATCLRTAERLFPGDPEVEFQRAMLERESGEPEKAQIRLERLLLDHPSEYGPWRLLLGLVRQDLGDSSGAIECFEAILKRHPGDGQARFCRALLALDQGDFSAGWTAYEARFLTEESPDRGYPIPSWDGRPIAGTLLAYAEQGVGDEVMFASCFPDAMRRCGRLIVQCDPRLERLFRRSFPDATIVGASRTDHSWLKRIPPVAAQVAAGSLPAHFRPDRASFEGRGPYLKSDSEQVESWRKRLQSLGPGPYIGLSWRGGLAKTRRAARSIPIEMWSSVLTASATWVSLQHDARDDELAALHQMAPVHHWAEIFEDLDTAASLLSALDHVLSVCNATVHLAGALGRPTTVLVPSVHEWRYGSDGETMAWYPSVRLLRRSRDDSWQPVLDAARRRLVERP